MSREKFEADLKAATEKARGELENRYIAEATETHNEREQLKAEISAIEEKKKRLAEIEGKPESGKEFLEGTLNFDQLSAWLRENNLEKYINLEAQIADQEKFYGEKIDRSKISVSAERLPAIKKALEVGCVNYAMIKVVPENISEKETQMTGAEFAFERFAKPLKKDGFKIWEEAGTGRWSKLTLAELLKRCNPAEPEEFDPEALKKDWVAEETRVIDKKGPAPKVKAGAVEIIFTNNLPDIPRDQKIVNEAGRIVEPDNRSYISAIADKVRVLSHEEGIILASQLYAKDKTHLAPNTWEWRRDVIDHRDKKTKPPVSAANAHSNDVRLHLNSYDADDSVVSNRLRVRL